MNRTGIIVHFLGVVSISLLLRGAMAEEPKELVKARKTYREKIQKATEPITKGYVKYLEGIKRKLGAKGRVEEAMAVQKEIDAVAIPKQSKAGVLTGVWKFAGSDDQVTFYADGRAVPTYKTTLKSWKHVSGLDFEFHFAGGEVVKVKMDESRRRIDTPRYQFLRVGPSR